jgi:hypothetical protein
MILRLDREETVLVHGRALTWGDLYLDGAHVACTLEDPVREIPGRHVSEWKIAEDTAIGAGAYEIGMRQSMLFGDDTIAVLNVPGFDLICIHGGTTTKDTKGCPLVGSRQDRLNGTLHGAKYAQKLGSVTVEPVLEPLKKKIKAALAMREKVWLQVRNAPAWYVRHGLPVPKALGVLHAA